MKGYSAWYLKTSLALQNSDKFITPHMHVMLFFHCVPRTGYAIFRHERISTSNFIDEKKKNVPHLENIINIFFVDFFWGMSTSSSPGGMQMHQATGAKKLAELSNLHFPIMFFIFLPVRSQVLSFSLPSRRPLKLNLRRTIWSGSLTPGHKFLDILMNIRKWFWRQ